MRGDANSLHPEPAVEVRDLAKEFRDPEGGKLRAVDGVSFNVRRGEVFGFLGPNGAGKTTTLEIIEGIQSPSGGSAKVLGFDSVSDRDEVKKRIGVQLQAAAYFDYLTLEEILDLFGSFYPRQLSPAHLLEKVGLLDKRKSPVRQLSGGQAQRFSIVASLVNDPEVVFLDEPTTSLDPQARRNLWDLISSIKEKDGKTVVLSTHYMEEAQVLCDEVAIIDRGKIQALDTPLSLIRQLTAAYRIIFSADRELDIDALAQLPEVTEVVPHQNGAFSWELKVSKAQITLPAFVRWAGRRKVGIEDVQVLPATLEDVFLSVTGRNLRD